MAISLAFEKLGNIPIKPENITSGTISAAGISTYSGIGNTVFAGSYVYDTITINLEGIVTPPYSKPGKNPGQATFSFRGKTWNILNVDEGNRIIIGGTNKYLTWSITGVNLADPRISVS